MELSKVTVEIFTKLENKWLSLSHHCGSSPRKTRLLSIDGGGTASACSPAAVSLLHLEDQIRLRTSDPLANVVDFFDVVAGTGTGAILASMLCAADADGRPMYTARAAVDLLERKAPELFKAAGRFLPRGRRSARLSGRSMDKALKEIFSSLTLKDTCKPLLVPCFDLESGAPFVFSRADAAGSPSFDFELWKVCRATSAAPGRFRPFALSSVDGKTACTAVDGGLVMNNPTAAAVTHVLHNKRDFPSVSGVEDLLVLSLGNGPVSGQGSVKLRRNGECSTSAVVDIALDGVSETVDQLLGNAFCWNRTDYVRIQANGMEDDVLKERGVEALPFGGKRLLAETNGQRIELFAQRLVAASSRTASLPPSPCKEAAVSPLADGR